MTHQDRDRLVFSLVLALLFHAGIIVVLSLIDWQIPEYQQVNTVYVEFLEYESAPPTTEPTPESVADPDPEEQQPAEEPLVEEQPVDNRLADAAPEAEPDEGSVTASVSPPAESRDAPPGSFSLDDPFMQDDSAAAAREEGRPDDPGLFTYDEVTETGELPVWVAEGTIQPLSSLEPADRENLAEKEDTVEGFAELMDLITQSLIAPQTTVDRSRPFTEEGEESSEVSLPGDSSLNWVGGGSRRAVGELALPDIGSDDLRGLVPRRLTYIIVFDVNSNGVVVPASLILRQSSGYTAADQKVRNAVTRWHFEPAPGSQPVTAIFTFVLERDDLR